jgi:hypothetical protein
VTDERESRPVTIFICSRGARWTARCSCGEKASKQCDFPLKGRAQGKTCDRHLCSKCAHPQPQVGPDKDYCPAHHALGQQELPLK